MRIEEYEDYVKVFDYFSKFEGSFPFGSGFVRLVAKLLAPGATVTDVGGGTGLFTTQLLFFLGKMNLTFIEPSPVMMAEAKKRLPESVAFIDDHFPAALDKVNELQDAFLFMRSFYALSENRSDYAGFPAMLKNKLNSGGILALLDFHQFSDDIGLKYERTKEIIVEKGMSLKELDENWKIMKRALTAAREGVENGIYQTFSEEELDELMLRSGLQKRLYKSAPFFYIAVYERPH